MAFRATVECVVLANLEKQFVEAIPVLAPEHVPHVGSLNTFLEADTDMSGALDRDELSEVLKAMYKAGDGTLFRLGLGFPLLLNMKIHLQDATLNASLRGVNCAVL